MFDFIAAMSQCRVMTTIFRHGLRRGFLGALSLLLVAPAHAQDAPKVSIIRDAEIEQLLRDYTAPIFKAAGIHSGAAKIIIVGDKSFNAFVADGQKIFINTGALVEAKTPNEIIGVLAHEAGHIAGGHLVRGRQELARATILSIAGMLASAGALYAATTSGAAGRRQGNLGVDSAGMAGIMLGPQEAVKRSLLSYQRSEEQAADRAAVKFLTATHQSAKGMLTVFERFANEAMFKSQTIDPYLLSHPLPTERISNLEAAAKDSPYFDAVDSPALQARHDLMRAKLVGFMGDAGDAARRYMSDNSIAGHYARAIADNKAGRLEQALAGADALIKAQPKNPYFWELKGQFLLEAARAEEAIAPLRKAAALAPAAAPIKALLGHALVATENPAYTDEAIRVLYNATQRDEDSPEAWEYLSMAYYRKGDEAKAQLAAAEGLFVAGKYVEARTQATRAKAKFREGSQGWLRADDILNYRPPGSTDE